MKAKFLIVCLCTCSVVGLAQINIDSIPGKSAWNKKFFAGVMFHNAIMGFEGDNLPMEYFKKPGLGLTIKAEYYFHRNIGVSAGFGYMQKGSGIITPDYVSYKDDLGNPDSTHRARIKMNALEFPISIILRSNSWKGIKAHLSGGIRPMYNVQSRFVMYSIEDGFHTIVKQTSRYYRTDVPIFFEAGLDINAGEATVFQVHFIGSYGTKNVFDSNAFPGADGRNVLYSLSLGYMF